MFVTIFFNTDSILNPIDKDTLDMEDVCFEIGSSNHWKEELFLYR